MTRANVLAPLLAVLILLAGLVAWQGPGWYRLWRFNQTCQAMLQSARAGNTVEVVAAIDPAQQQLVSELLQRYLPADYHTRIRSLKLTSWQKRDAETILAIVTCRIDHGDSLGLYQGKLYWRWRDGRWYWDFGASYGAQFSLEGEPEWIKLSSLVELAELL